MRPVLLSLAGVFAMPSASAQVEAGASLLQREASFEGLTRSWLIYEPSAAEGPARAIVLLLHGNGGSAAQLMGQATGERMGDRGRRDTASARWLDIARRERLVLIVPDGTPGSTGARGWNDCRADAETNPQVDDVRWLMSLIAEARAAQRAPRLPVLATGLSNGGNLVLRLAIEKPDEFVSVAAVIAAMPARSECPAPSKPVNVIVMNGTADPILPWSGGTILLGGARRGSVVSTDESVAVWARLDGVAGAAGAPAPPPTESQTLPDLDPDDGGAITRSLWRGRSGRETILYRVEGGGHNGPRRGAPSVPGMKQNRDIDMADQIWSDFRRHLAAFAGGAALAAVSAAPVVATAAATAASPAPAPASTALAAQIRSTRILVAGGTGRNGSAVVAALEALGAKPRVLARDVAKARERFPGARDWVEGDVTRPETLAAAVKGIDVIINAVATNQIDGPNGVEAVDLGGMRNLIAAAKPAGVKRIVLITGATVGRDPASWPPPLQKGMAIKRETEKFLIASGIDYVILRPTGILARPGNDWAIGIFAQSEYRPPEGEMRFGRLNSIPPPEQPPPPGTIARPDLAEVTIVSAVEPRARNRIFVVSHGEGRASSVWTARLEWMPRE